MDIKTRHFLRKDELKELKNTLKKTYGEIFVNQVFPDKCKVEIIITEEEDQLYAVNDELALWKSKEGYLPILSLLLDNRVGLKTVVVDMGAVKFVTNGADIMRPGITKIDSNIKKDEIIRISDEKNDRTLAVGKAMYDARKMKEKSKGKVVKNLHTIQDDVWEFAKTF